MRESGLGLEELRALLATGQYSLSRHAFRRLVERNPTMDTIREAGVRAELLEDYPGDKYSPSCLLLGFVAGGVPLHLQVSRTRNPTVRIVTLYVPSERDWIDFRFRRSGS